MNTALPPKHIAIIMDGNGRWASSLGKRRTYGHYIGSKIVDDITKASVALGIKYLTLYAFSTENWKRPASEVRFLISLLHTQIQKKETLFEENEVRFNTIGDVSVYPQKTQDMLKRVRELTKNNKRMVLTLALNYGSKLEITAACKKIASDIKKGKLNVSDISEDLINKNLFTYDMPDVDLLIRTGGEKRVSNFLLWQSSYAELIFFDKYWPEFTKEDLEKAIEEFKHRKRRFGGL